MSTLPFALKFSATFFVLCLHIGLLLLFILSFVTRSGQRIEAVALGIEAFICFMVSIRLLYLARYRKMTSAQRMRRRSIIGERVFIGVLLVLNFVNSAWICLHSLALSDGFAGLPRPEFAVIAAIALTFTAFAVSLHLIWFIAEEETLSPNEVSEEPIQWPSTASTFTPEPTRHRPLVRGGRISAKIVTVQHGSPPELWAKHRPMVQREAAPPVLQPARPTYDPKARQLRAPPPIKTSQYQWYITPGEAF